MYSRLLLAAAACLVPAAAPAAPPNLIVIVGDDMGYADVGTHGCKDIPTPNLDALARGGVRFTNGYVSGPYCSPTRAGLLTGRYQQRFGHEFNPAGGGETVGLSVKETTLADRLKAAGYATGLVGKWHLGDAPHFHPTRRGFDEYFGFLGGAHAYFPMPKAAPIFRGTKEVEEREYLTDAFGREAVAFVEAHKGHPFFLYLAFNAVHTPMHADDARLKKFASIADPTRQKYAAMMTAMDESVGKLLAKLRDAKLAENTVIVFFSDNGGPILQGTSINGSVNAPLRGSKRTTLEGGVRVPFFASWPGKLPANVTDDRPVIQLDVLPTLLAAAGVEAKPEWKLDGVNLLPYLAGDKTAAAPHDALFWRMGQQMAVRKGDWKLVRYDQAADGKTGTSPARLYNLKDDVGEATDLAAREPARVKELQAEWDRWNAGNVPPSWGGAAKKD